MRILFIILITLSGLLLSAQDRIEKDSCYNDIESVGIEKEIFQEIDWKVTPNPTRGEIIILGNTLSIKTIEVYSITGVLVRFIENTSKNINLYSYPNGIYLIRITSLNNQVKTFKILKK